MANDFDLNAILALTGTCLVTIGLSRLIILEDPVVLTARLLKAWLVIAASVGLWGAIAWVLTNGK